MLPKNDTQQRRLCQTNVMCLVNVFYYTHIQTTILHVYRKSPSVPLRDAAFSLLMGCPIPTPMFENLGLQYVLCDTVNDMRRKILKNFL